MSDWSFSGMLSQAESFLDSIDEQAATAISQQMGNFMGEESSTSDQHKEKDESHPINSARSPRSTISIDKDDDKYSKVSRFTGSQRDEYWKPTKTNNYDDVDDKYKKKTMSPKPLKSSNWSEEEDDDMDAWEPISKFKHSTNNDISGWMQSPERNHSPRTATKASILKENRKKSNSRNASPKASTTRSTRVIANNNSNNSNNNNNSNNTLNNSTFRTTRLNNHQNKNIHDVSYEPKSMANEIDSAWDKNDDSWDNNEDSWDKNDEKWESMDENWNDNNENDKDAWNQRNATNPKTIYTSVSPTSTTSLTAASSPTISTTTGNKDNQRLVNGVNEQTSDLESNNLVDGNMIETKGNQKLSLNNSNTHSYDYNDDTDDIDDNDDNNDNNDNDNDNDSDNDYDNHINVADVDKKSNSTSNEEDFLSTFSDTALENDQLENVHLDVNENEFFR